MRNKRQSQGIGFKTSNSKKKGFVRSCIRSGSGPSLETSDVTLVWDDGKRVEAHKEVEEVLGVV